MNLRVAASLVWLSFAGCHSTAASPDAGCPDLETFCATQGTTCIRDWTTASMAATWCVRGDAGVSGPGGQNVVIREGCDGYDVVWFSSLDTGHFFVYDATTGQLVGAGRAGSDTCLGGTLPASANISAICGTGTGESVCLTPSASDGAAD